MEVVWLMCYVLAAGAVGGTINAIMHVMEDPQNNFLVLPKFHKIDDGEEVFRPGILSNVLIGSIAALISWGLYGPWGQVVVFGPQRTDVPLPSLTLSALICAILVGIGGARGLSNEVDKVLLRTAAVNAAMSPADPGLAQQLKTSSPTRMAMLAADAARPVVGSS